MFQLMNDEILKKFAEGKFQSSGGCLEEGCDICQDSSFLQEAVDNTNPLQCFRLNLCNKHAGQAKPAQTGFEQNFQKQWNKTHPNNKLQDNWFQRMLNKLRIA